MKFINSSILPSFMIVLQNLKYLNLSFNKLDSLEILENYCPNLIHLDLSHNLLKKLRVNSSIVEYLDISYNDFQKIEDFALNISDKLIFLNIKGMVNWAARNAIIILPNFLNRCLQVFMERKDI